MRVSLILHKIWKELLCSKECPGCIWKTQPSYTEVAMNVPDKEQRTPDKRCSSRSKFCWKSKKQLSENRFYEVIHMTNNKTMGE